MRISYNIPTQTVSLDFEPGEIKELKDDVRANIKGLFKDTVLEMREQIDSFKDRLSGTAPAE